MGLGPGLGGDTIPVDGRSCRWCVCACARRRRRRRSLNLNRDAAANEAAANERSLLIPRVSLFPLLAPYPKTVKTYDGNPN